MKKICFIISIFAFLFFLPKAAEAGEGYGWAKKVQQAAWPANTVNVKSFAYNGTPITITGMRIAVGDFYGSIAQYTCTGQPGITCTNPAGNQYTVSGFANGTYNVYLSGGLSGSYREFLIPYRNISFNGTNGTIVTFEVYADSITSGWRNQQIGPSSVWYNGVPQLPQLQVNIRPSVGASCVNSIIWAIESSVHYDETLSGSWCGNPLAVFPQAVPIQLPAKVDGWYTWLVFTGDSNSATTGIAAGSNEFGIDRAAPTTTCSLSWADATTVSVSRTSTDPNPTGANQVSGVKSGSGSLNYRTSTDGVSWGGWISTGDTNACDPTGVCVKYNLTGANNTLYYQFQYRVSDNANSVGAFSVCSIVPVPITPTPTSTPAPTPTPTTGPTPTPTTGPTPTPTPTPVSTTGQIGGRIYNDINANGVRDPATEPWIQNGILCGAGYPNLAVSVSYSGPSAGSVNPNLCDPPDPYFATAQIPTSGVNYTAWVTVPAGWTVTNGRSSDCLINDPCWTWNSINKTISGPLNSGVFEDLEFGISQTYTISGNVFEDNGACTSPGVNCGILINGFKDGAERNIAGATVTRSGTGTTTATTNSLGNYSFTGLTAGAYTVTLTVPAGYTPTTANPASPPCIGPSPCVANATANFGIIFNAPTYTISGNVFVDDGKCISPGVGCGTPKDGLKNGAETNWTTSAITITFFPTGAFIPTLTYPTPGQFTVSNLTAGAYTISYTATGGPPGTLGPPAGYYVTSPTNGPPPSRIVSVGPSAVDINFGIAPYPAWIQSTGTDIRFDNGFNYYLPPPGGSCVPVNSYASVAGSGGIPGIIFTGNSNAIFGQGVASSKLWVVGGSLYPELFTPSKGNVIRTSYSYINAQIKQAGLTAAPITTWNANCIISSGCSLTGIGHGLYSSNPPNVYINASTLNCTNGANPGNCVFLINGNLNILGNIRVNLGATATFIVSGDIIVDPSVGNAIAGDITTTTPQIEGFYSTDKNFIIPTANVCPAADKRLNIAGSVIVNAGLTGGTFQNQRDLCGSGNALCPVFSIQERPDFILNAPDIIKYQNTIYREEAP